MNFPKHTTSTSVHLTDTVEVSANDYHGEQSGAYLNIDGVGAIHFNDVRQAEALLAGLNDVRLLLIAQAEGLPRPIAAQS